MPPDPTEGGTVPGARGVSPAVGVVLLTGIAVAMVAVGGTMLFATFDRPDPAPTPVLELQAGETPPTQVIRHRGGSDVGGTNRTTVRGIANPDVLHAEELTAGERVAVVPVAEEIRLVWRGRDGRTYVLWRATPTSYLSTSPDEGCGWVKARTNNGTDPITVDGVTVNCDIVTEGDIDVVNGAVVIGTINSTENNVDLDEATVYGPVDADGDVDLDGTEVSGSVVAGGDDVVLTDGSSVGGDIRIDSGNVDVDGGSSVDGSVEAGGNIDLDSATVNGSLSSDTGDVVLTDSTVGGSIATGGNVDLDSSTVGGEVYLAGTFSCSGSTVNGRDCGNYTPEDYADR